MTRTFRRLASSLALLLFALLPLTAFAQQQGLEIDIVGGNAAALPIAVVPMPFQGARRCARDGRGVGHPRRPGSLRPVPHAAGPATWSSARPRARRSTIRRGACSSRTSSSSAGSRMRGDGSYRVEYELFDVAKQQRLLGFAMTARSECDARCRAPDRRRDLRKDPRRARRILDADRVHHRGRHVGRASSTR